MTPTENISDLIVMQPTQYFNLVCDVVFVTHFDQEGHLWPIAAYNEVDIRMPSYDFRNDHNEKINTLSVSESLDAYDVNRVYG